MANDPFSKLAHNAKSQLGDPRSPYSAKGKTKTIQINYRLYRILKKDAFIHDGTTITHWADRAIRYAKNKKII